jgi:hypothetical protein
LKEDVKDFSDSSAPGRFNHKERKELKERTMNFEIRKFAWSKPSKIKPSGTALNLLSALFAFFAVNT